MVSEISVSRGICPLNSPAGTQTVAQSVRNLLDDFAEALGFSRMPMGDARQTLAEDLSLTIRIATAPAADSQLQVDGPPLHGEVFQMPHVAAVARG